MKKYLLHFWTITLHKYYVAQECFKRGLYWQGIVHDLSKYSPTEFLASARYFQGDKTPIGAEKAEKGYSYAWLNHKGKNRHHWEYWIDFKEGELFLCPIPEKYVVEMACDMIGASKAYNKGKYTPSEPLHYFQLHKFSMRMHPDAKELLEKLLREVAGQSVNYKFSWYNNKAKKIAPNYEPLDGIISEITRRNFRTEVSHEN